jgi:chaperone modulatory protein CbpM
MITFNAVVALFPDLEPVELTTWIEQRWVEPARMENGGWTFDDLDVARIRLIYDLRRELEIPEETVPLLLSLLDQVYELRRTLNVIRQALAAQPREVQSAVLAALKAPDERA